jgi:transcription elongation factor GreB
MNADKSKLTKPGHQRLTAEREELARVTRPRVVKGIADAAAEGDRSENAEYIYGKKHLREIDKRLAYLGGLLKDVQIVELSSLSGEKVCFASTVVVLDQDDVIRKWTIVGDGEADYREGTISYKSPVARALMGKEVGDVVEIERPKGMAEVEIVGLLFGNKLIKGEPG